MSMGDIGGAVGGIASGIGGLFKKKKPKFPYQRQAQDLMWGMALPALANWGQSQPEQYLESQPKVAKDFVKRFGADIPHVTTPGTPAPQQFQQFMGGGQHGIMNPMQMGGMNPMQARNPFGMQSMMGQFATQPKVDYGETASRVLDFMRTPKIRFGYGGGNMGGYTGGYGGPLS